MVIYWQPAVFWQSNVMLDVKKRTLEKVGLYQNVGLAHWLSDRVSDCHSVLDQLHVGLAREPLKGTTDPLTVWSYCGEKTLHLL